MSKRRFVISDIHGCCKTFKRLLSNIGYCRDDGLYLLGDYIDRGPDSKGVIDHIFELKAEGYEVHCLMGNHEKMMLDAILFEDAKYRWLYNGGAQTMDSFGIGKLKDLDDVYVDFFKNLGLYIEEEDCLLVHAGINFKETNPLDDEFAMLWIRRWYDDVPANGYKGKLIVHGHTPLLRKNIEMMNEKTHLYIDIDAACVYNSSTVEGYLCAFELNERKLHFLRNID